MDVRLRLNEKRDMTGTKTFLEGAREISEKLPEPVFTDGLTSYSRALEEELGEVVKHLVISCQGNLIVQSHRVHKYRYYLTLRFGDLDSAQRFGQAYDEVSNFFRTRSRMTELVCLSEQRKKFIKRVEE